MSGLLRTLLSLSLSGAAMIALLLLLRPLFRDRVSKGWQYLLWLVVILRLLVPVGPQMSLMNRLFTPSAGEETPIVSQGAPGEDALWEEEGLSLPSQAPAVPEGESAGSEAASPSPQETSEPAVTPLPRWNGELIAAVLCILWAAVGTGLFLYKVIFSRRFVRRMLAGARPVEDPRLLARMGQLARSLGLRRQPALLVNPLAPTPMVIGVFRPRIILPRAEEGTAFSCAVLHELVHCRRGDLALRWLGQIALCIHWFNPLVWKMEREMGRDCELACDEGVIRRLDGPGRRAYGDLLLRTAAAGGRGSLPVPLPLSRGGRLLRERLSAIAGYRGTPKPLGGALLAAGLICWGMVLGVYAAPEGPSPDTSVPQDGESISGEAEASEPLPPREIPLPEVTGPDEEGRFPLVSDEDFETWVDQGPPDGAKPDSGTLTPFMENPKGTQWLAETYPQVTGWKVLAETQDYGWVPRMYDPYRYQWRDQWVPCYGVVLEAEGDESFDRVAVFARQEISVFQEGEAHRPTQELVICSWTGREEDWQMGDFSHWTITMPGSAYQLPAFWNGEEGRGLLLGYDGSCLPVKGEGPFCPIFAGYEVGSFTDPGPGWEEDRLLVLRSGAERQIVWYHASSRELTLLERDPDGAPQIFFLDSRTLAIQTDERISFYDLTQGPPRGEPDAVLGGNGEGLGADPVWIFYQIASLREGGGSHAAAYYRPGEKEWRICTFDSSGQLLSDFPTGLEVVEDYLLELAYTQGLVYFGYYREGSGQPDSLERYCADARPGRDHTLQRIP